MVISLRRSAPMVVIVWRALCVQTIVSLFTSASRGSFRWELTPIKFCLNCDADCCLKVAPYPTHSLPLLLSNNVLFLFLRDCQGFPLSSTATLANDWCLQLAREIFLSNLHTWVTVLEPVYGYTECSTKTYDYTEDVQENEALIALLYQLGLIGFFLRIFRIG